MQDQDIPRGLCQCGCGAVTRIASKTITKKRVVKGQPLRYVNGHNTARVRQGPDYIVDANGCWIWQHATLGPNGYGVVRDPIQRRNVTAHRYYFEKIHGRVPGNLDLHHRCEVKLCCNPEHLEILTRSEHKKLHAALSS